MPLTAVPRHRLMSPEIRFFASPTLQRDHRTSVTLFLSFLPLSRFLFIKLIICRNSWLCNFKYSIFLFVKYPTHLSYMKAIIFLFLLFSVSIGLTVPSGMILSIVQSSAGMKEFNVDTKLFLCKLISCRVSLLHTHYNGSTGFIVSTIARNLFGRSKVFHVGPAWSPGPHPRPLPSCKFTIPWLFRRLPGNAPA